MSDGLRNCLFHAPEVILAVKTRGSGRARTSFRSRVCALVPRHAGPAMGRSTGSIRGSPGLCEVCQHDAGNWPTRVTSGDRLPLPPLTSSSSASLNGSTAGGDVPGAVNENEVKVDQRRSSVDPWVAQHLGQMAKMINRCFQTAPEERPHMSKILFHLRRMHREEEMKELKCTLRRRIGWDSHPRRAPHERRCICRESQSEGWCGASGVTTPVESVEGKGDNAGTGRNL